jgi:ABC-type antimicrobial peptide transport system permease subunit
MARTAFATVMLSLAAGIALLLAIIGVFGVITYIVTQRTREMGIRMALGSAPRQVRLLFLRQGLWLTSAGIVIGVGFALVLSGVLSALLFGIGPGDPATYAGVSGILAVVALLAMYLPARQAARVEPIVALRADG